MDENLSLGSLGYVYDPTLADALPLNVNGLLALNSGGITYPIGFKISGATFVLALREIAP